MISDIWERKRPYIIAEISQNHDGSLGQAHAFIDAVATTGADAIKFQTHIAAEESSKYDQFRVKFSYEDKTRYDYWRRMEFSQEEWSGLYSHAQKRGLDFLSSPFSIKALKMLDQIGIQAWKFGAGEVFDEELLDRAVNTGKPILLSAGLSTFDEMAGLVEKVLRHGNRAAVFQCVTAYPSTADMIDISLISRFKEAFPCEIGISDHSATIYPALSAMTLGASAVEVHVTMSPYMFGPDVRASVDLGQLKQIVDGAKFISTMLQTKSDLNELTESKKELRGLFSKSIYAAEEIPENAVIEPEMIVTRKPNIGIPSGKKELIIGKRTKHAIMRGEPVKEEDLI